jgi:hypothetical protein
MKERICCREAFSHTQSRCWSCGKKLKPRTHTHCKKCHEQWIQQKAAQEDGRCEVEGK